MSDGPTITVLSLGAGVQSTTLLLLAVEGALPKPDAAIFADTGWEPRAVGSPSVRSSPGTSAPTPSTQPTDSRACRCSSPTEMAAPA